MAYEDKSFLNFPFVLNSQAVLIPGNFLLFPLVINYEQKQFTFEIEDYEEQWLEEEGYKVFGKLILANGEQVGQQVYLEQKSAFPCLFLYEHLKGGYICY